MSTTLQTEEIELESREMNVWRCFECQNWSQELDAEIMNVICQACGSRNVMIERSFMYDREMESV